MSVTDNTQAAPSGLADELVRAEALLVDGRDEAAEALLAELASDAEEYVDRNCHTTDEVQWFSFPTIFERLCYRRVERDPRRLVDVGEPLDRLYADLALACVRLGDYARATEALKQAVRWNPMDCAHRLNLADLFLTNGDEAEFLALSFSVFERASDATHLVRAYLNFARHYERTGQDELRAACLRCARRLEMPSAQLDAQLEAAKGTPADPDALDDARAREVLAAEGLPEGANAEVAVCLLMCASDAAAAGERNLATELTVRARDLVGAPVASALVRLIREADEGDEGGAGASAAPEGR